MRFQLGTISVTGETASAVVRLLKSLDTNISNIEDDTQEFDEDSQKVKNGLTIDVYAPKGIAESAQMIQFITNMLERNKVGDFCGEAQLDFNAIYHFQAACIGACVTIAKFFDTVGLTVNDGKSGWLSVRLPFLLDVVRTTTPEELEDTLDRWRGVIDSDALELAERTLKEYLERQAEEPE